MYLITKKKKENSSAIKKMLFKPNISLAATNIEKVFCMMRFWIVSNIENIKNIIKWDHKE
jgi:hypothetical protein